LDRSENDVTALSEGASLICEKDWAALIGDQDEVEYIASMGYDFKEVTDKLDAESKEADRL